MIEYHDTMVIILRMAYGNSVPALMVKYFLFPLFLLDGRTRAFIPCWWTSFILPLGRKKRRKSKEKGKRERKRREVMKVLPSIAIKGRWRGRAS
jgi:hypothetical protein